MARPVAAIDPLVGRLLNVLGLDKSRVKKLVIVAEQDNVVQIFAVLHAEEKHLGIVCEAFEVTPVVAVEVDERCNVTVVRERA